MIIYCKVAKQITEPIYKLQEAIENNNVKDESVFVYKYDDIINELIYFTLSFISIYPGFWPKSIKPGYL